MYFKLLIYMPVIEILGFFLAVILIGLIPFFVLFGFSNIVYLILYKILGYRKRVVFENLKGCFPNNENDEINRIASGFYKNLCDIFIESIKAFTMSRRQILARHKIINPEVLEQFYKTNQSVIGVTGHYCNWEWGSLSASLQTPYKVVAFYMPLMNRTLDRFVRWSRSRFGTTLASVADTSITFEKYKDLGTVFLMAADQGIASKYRDRAYWIQFLNRDTPFLYGLEKHSRNNNLPVIYIDVQRVKRGYYTLELTVLTANPVELPDGMVTELYARKLEQVIQKKPENWLWSHRRWKVSR